MKRVFVAMMLAAGVVGMPACGEDPKPNPPPPDQPTTLPAKVRISGSARLHPDALVWLGLAAQAPPSLAGGKITVEEGLKATSGQPPLSTGAVDGDGDYDFAAVDMTQVAIGIFSRLDDPQGSSADALVPSGTPLFRGRPGVDLSGKIAYGIPRAYARALNDAVTDDPDQRVPPTYLEREGFILGKIVDSNGNGVAGAKLHVFNAALHSEKLGVFYLDAQTDATVRAVENGMTSASGAFVFVPEAGRINEYTAVRGSDTFDKHLAGANEGTGFTLIIKKE